MDTTKLKGIRDWPIPTTVKQVRAFLGFGNFYHRFIRGFSNLAQPMNGLLKKDRKFEWTDKCQKSFETLKQWFTEEPVLAMPDHTRPFQIESDASKYVTGVVLSQLDSNGDRHGWPFFQKPFHRLNEITKSMTENCLQWFAHLKSGNTISKDQDTLQMFSLIIKIWRYTKKHGNWKDDKHDGSFSYQNTTSSWSIHLEKRW